MRQVIVPAQHSRILDRTLIYTAVTRATEHVVLIGDAGVLAKAVQDLPSASRRRTGLLQAFCLGRNSGSRIIPRNNAQNEL